MSRLTSGRKTILCLFGWSAEKCWHLRWARPISGLSAGGCAILGGVSSGAVFAQRILPLAVLLIAAVSVPVMIFSPSGLARLHNLREEKRRADDEISRLSQEIRELRAEVRRIKDDPAAVERAARDELGLIRQTEVVFQFRD